MVGTLRPQPNARPVVEPEPPAFGLFGRDFQPLTSPDPFNALLVHRPSKGADQLHTKGQTRHRPYCTRAQFITWPFKLLHTLLYGRPRLWRRSSQGRSHGRGTTWGRMMQILSRILAGVAIATIAVVAVTASDPAFAFGRNYLPTSSVMQVKAKRAGDVPGPIVGAGLPVLAVGYGMYWLVARRRRETA
jgi:hypothetical protein